MAFELIVAAGKNGSQCHAVPSDNQVHKGDFITMDTGALLDGLPLRHDPHRGPGPGQR